jgi:exopolyphosphatase/guanosine-5'-triphosphate,3'-diphosphate pyrophosphatase
MTTGARSTILGVRVGVIDVGSNTVRLLVAGHRGSRLAPVREERAFLRLGEDVERLGWISEEKLREAVRCVSAYARVARSLGCRHVEVAITAPGRRAANGDELASTLAGAAGAPTRVLSADEEGRLAYAGALTAAGRVAEPIAVCDVGGGSAEVVVGTSAGPAWSRSLDIGSLVVRERFLTGNPPGKEAVSAARDWVSSELDGFAPPLPRTALATGGTARALRRLSGSTLGRKQLSRALRKLAKRSVRELADDYGLDERRLQTLPAGAVVLTELQRRLVVPLEVSRAGLREGLAAVLLAELAAA